MSGQKTKLSSDSQIDQYCIFLKAQLKKGGSLNVSVERERQRTLTQNRAMRKYWELLAQTLNDAGLDMMAVLKPGIAIPWSAASIEERIWRGVQIAKTGKKSTKELDTKDMSIIYDVVNNHLSSTFGVFQAWPCQENFRSYEE